QEAVEVFRRQRSHPSPARGRLGLAFPQCARVRAARHRSFAGRRYRPHQPRLGARIFAWRPAAMNDQPERGVAPAARVIERGAAADAAPWRRLGPQYIPTDAPEAATPSEPALPALAPVPPRRRDRVMTFGLAGVAVLLTGWLAVDAVAWILAAFERSAALGVLAAAAVAAGGAGGGGGGGPGAPKTFLPPHNDGGPPPPPPPPPTPARRRRP